jgi:hypothetical protein
MVVACSHVIHPEEVKSERLAPTSCRVPEYGNCGVGVMGNNKTFHPQNAHPITRDMKVLIFSSQITHVSSDVMVGSVSDGLSTSAHSLVCISELVHSIIYVTLCL